ncbi:hypothetical protein [Nitratireductor sp. StC3]|uniref:hypothetical protein n=1 Tax=Nitratireductor sp. StC3 TaxID=2126741 RepID=UPI0011B29BEE|nr:hypothetical protein [Nitratireductor sp. StC3]
MIISQHITEKYPDFSAIVPLGPASVFSSRQAAQNSQEPTRFGAFFGRSAPISAILIGRDPRFGLVKGRPVDKIAHLPPGWRMTKNQNRRAPTLGALTGAKHS